MSQELSTAQYDTFYAVRKRTSNNGVFMMPVAGPYPTPAAVVALNGGLELDTVRFIAVRNGAPPNIPAPVTVNPNRIFLSGEQSAVFPVGSIGNVMAYAVAGEYVFGILSPEGLRSTFMIGTLPFTGVFSNNENINYSYIIYGLINDRVTQIVPDGTPSYFASLPPLLQRVLGENRDSNQILPGQVLGHGGRQP